jgi:putative hydroxymethylpyrimidine transport system permease protein
VVLAALIIVALLAVWQGIVELGWVDELILPAPTEVATSLWEDRRLLGEDLAVTSQEVLIGLAAAVALGAVLGIGMHLSPTVRSAFRPLVIGSQAVPVPVIAPLLNLYDGLRRVDPDAHKLLRSFHASRWQTFRHLEAPAALPAAFTGLKVAAAVSVIGAVFAEWAGSDSGLGHALLTANGQLETARAFAATFLLFALAISLYGIFALLERRVVTWR